MLTLLALLVAVLFLSSPWNLVVVATAATIDMIEIAVMVWWSRRPSMRGPPAVGTEAMVGRFGIALERLDGVGIGPGGQVRVDGETWGARSAEPIERGATVRVRSVDGLVLAVEPMRPE
jgi:membrane protein implicated in regulation of membrane protease activity